LVWYMEDERGPFLPRVRYWYTIIIAVHRRCVQSVYNPPQTCNDVRDTLPRFVVCTRTSRWRSIERSCKYVSVRRRGITVSKCVCTCVYVRESSRSRIHCSTSRRPPLAAIPQVSATFKGGSCSRTHRSTSRLPSLDMAAQADSPKRHPLSCTHRRHWLESRKLRRRRSSGDDRCRERNLTHYKIREGFERRGSCSYLSRGNLRLYTILLRSKSVRRSRCAQRWVRWVWASPWKSKTPSQNATTTTAVGFKAVRSGGSGRVNDHFETDFDLCYV